MPLSKKKDQSQYFKSISSSSTDNGLSPYIANDERFVDLLMPEINKDSADSNANNLNLDALTTTTFSGEEEDKPDKLITLKIDHKEDTVMAYSLWLKVQYKIVFRIKNYVVCKYPKGHWRYWTGKF